MPEYIDRQAALDAIMGLLTSSEKTNMNLVHNQTIRTSASIIDSLPPADVRPVVRGEWKTAWLDHEAFGERPRVLYCSACNQVTAIRTPFCPNCGADMRKEVQE